MDDNNPPVTLGIDERLARRLANASAVSHAERVDAFRKILSLPPDSQDDERRGSTIKFAIVDWKKLKKFLARAPRTAHLDWVHL